MGSKTERAVARCRQVIAAIRPAGVRQGSFEDAKVVVRLSFLDRFHDLGPWAIDAMLCAIAVAVSILSVHYYGRTGSFYGPFGTSLFVALRILAVFLWRRLPVVTLILGFLATAADGDRVIIPLAALGIGLYTNRPETYAGLAVLIYPVVGLHWNPNVVGFLFNAVTGVYLIALPMVAGVFVRRKRELQFYMEQKARKLRESIDQSVHYAVAEERTRLAFEIHDGLGHQLSVLAIQARVVQLAPSDSDAMRSAVAAIPEAAQRAVQEMHVILSSLRGGADHDSSQEFSATARLEFVPTLIENLQKTGVDVEYVRRGESRDVPAEVSHLIYRVVQEGLTNAVKHATGTHIRITLEFLARRIDVSVYNSRPEGVLLDIGSGGTGLDSLRRRLESADGNLTALSTREGGFLLKAALPTPHLPGTPPVTP
ncbi:sensor histidine kinase [Streptoverticillium reticulum]|uniref:sensor histidine kinase n=1 Tax=Streptoverticillium reticulum TaxID=1433415 RepID=UPI0039BFA238